ncbi:Bro-N domain-containing protein [Sinorhizobium meliloti]|uniref:BRO-N domain-containing protein n=1 Tax=Rhizobium meliloti TaxID=382 RepID=UPI000FDCCA24|nr:BRO family protein [Sinorhizobium meliloti]RVK93390.1 hypothetical protein CN152_23295 [Sinorhizobium meliloti]RVN47468.1 hypothetical protein CN113_12935 [Sinorhizobium meliloti]
MIVINDQPWFVATDVCRVLGYANPTEMVRPLDAQDKAKNFLDHRPINLISEAGLYQTIMRAQCTNPLARQFQGWVSRTVLPAIRKDGGYILGVRLIVPIGQGHVTLSKDASTQCHMNGY